MQNTAAADDTEKTKGAAPAIFGIDIRFFGVAMIYFPWLCHNKWLIFDEK